MIHSFELIRHQNGNSTVVFYEGPENKKRKIVFQKDSNAQWLLHYYCYKGMSFINIFKRLREKYVFKANKNNPWIFRPFDKSLILNTSSL